MRQRLPALLRVALTHEVAQAVLKLLLTFCLSLFSAGITDVGLIVDTFLNVLNLTYMIARFKVFFFVIFSLK